MWPLRGGQLGVLTAWWPQGHGKRFREPAELYRPFRGPEKTSEGTSSTFYQLWGVPSPHSFKGQGLRLHPLMQGLQDIRTHDTARAIPG